ncbi:MAG: DNA polymerase III subunit gamma/tau [Desulforhopalus sp.]|nr:DNA polymerase III subunit gamma/tau [Desulforhopalus sp.]
MSYLVLARKSRPQTFDQVVGQRPVIRTLQNSILRNRVAHALLFSGVRGVGKTTIARIMAKAINCQAEPADRPCDQCPSCREIASGSSFDLTEIDGASNRGIQEIRELKEKIKFLPTSAQYRIIIIDEVHMLTTEAFNALLKTLEEPPAHVYFMFATTEIHKIPVTILSRCQQYELKRISAGELYDHFQKLAAQEGFAIEPAALSLIVREAGGSVRDGLSLLDQMFSFGEKTITSQDVVEVLGLVSREVLMRLTRGLLEGSLTEVLTALAEIFSFGIDIKRFADDLMACFRALVLCKIDGCTGLIDLPTEELSELQSLATNYTRETLHLKLALLMAMAEELRFANQPRLTMETAFLKIIESANVVPVTTLLGHLKEILDSLPACPATTFLPPEQATHVVAKKIEQPVTKAVQETSQPSAPLEVGPPPEKIPDNKPATEKIGAAPLQPAQVQAEEATPQKPAAPEVKETKSHPHVKSVRKDWLEFIHFVKERKVWMAQDLQRADGVRLEGEDELQLTYSDPANCSLLRQKEHRQILTEFAVDFFQKPLRLRFVVPKNEDPQEASNGESPNQKRAQLASDPLVIMAAEIFNGDVGDIRISQHNK